MDSTRAKVVETPTEKPVIPSPTSISIEELGIFSREEGPVSSRPKIKMKFVMKITLRLSSDSGRRTHKEVPTRFVKRSREKAPLI